MNVVGFSTDVRFLAILLLAPFAIGLADRA
jgi:hypothetical protein